MAASLIITHMDDTWTEVDMTEKFWKITPHGLMIKNRHEDGEFDGNRRVFPWANVKCYDVVIHPELPPPPPRNPAAWESLAKIIRDINKHSAEAFRKPPPEPGWGEGRPVGQTYKEQLNYLQGKESGDAPAQQAEADTRDQSERN